MEKQEKKQIKPLCLSFWTPPTNRPKAILICKMIPEWINQGIRPVIVTYEKNGDWNIDTPVYKIPQFKLRDFINRSIYVPIAVLFISDNYRPNALVYPFRNHFAYEYGFGPVGPRCPKT